jgi:predicted ATPase/DNA-binding winged helix-turn-helix (wHTH) protein
MDRCAFGDFVIDPGTRELLRAGRPVPLSPKAFQLLGILVESRPRALSKSELQDRLWPGTFVVEKNLTNLVGEIRAALGDAPAHPSFIRTVPRFGYAFLDSRGAEVRDGGACAHNLPEALTSFIGREREIANVVRLLASARLLTLTGAGGCGKTRLALEAARKLTAGFRDGMWLVDLTPLSEAGLVPQTVASALDVRPGPNRSFGDALSDYFRARQVLLVLDNCEHLIAACARFLAPLLRAAPRLTILATSRERLAIDGETVWRVPSLSLPDSGQPASVETLSRCEAVCLFLERAAGVDPAFAMTTGNAPIVADVCRRLDGIPLAIELAAARLNVLTIDQIHSRLNDRFRLLTGGSRTAVARQRTLEAAVEWSYDLLSEPERRLLRRLSVFAGGWTIETAEDACSDVEVERDAVVDLLSRLVDKSLVVVDNEADGSRRYRFLESVRQYGRERLAAPGEADDIRNRHLAVFLDLARRAEPELTKADQVRWLNRLQAEHDNLRSALEWSLAAPDASDRSLEMATMLFWFWMKRGYFAEGQRSLERALATGARPRSALRAQALMGLGNMTFFQGDFARTRALLGESELLARAAGELSVAAFALGISAIAAKEMGDHSEGARLAAEGLAAGRASDLPWMQAPSLTCLAYEALHARDFDRAGRLHEQGLELLRERGEKWGMGIVLFDLAVLRVVQERHPEARALSAEGIALYQEFGDRRGIGWCLGILAGADAAEGHGLRAARLRGAMEGLLASVGAPVQPSYNTWIAEPFFTAVQRTLGAGVYENALAEGRAMSLVQAIDYALESGSSGERSR